MKKTIYIWTYMYESEYNENGFGISHIVRYDSYENVGQIETWKLSDRSAFITETKLEIDIPNFDAVELRKEILQAQLNTVTAQYYAGKAMLEDKLSKLEAIEHLDGE